MRRLKLPRMNEPLVDKNGLITRAWYEALRDAEIDEQDVTLAASAGAAALPATPEGFEKVKINGTIRKVPFYGN